MSQNPKIKSIIEHCQQEQSISYHVGRYDGTSSDGATTEIRKVDDKHYLIFTSKGLLAEFIDVAVMLTYFQ